MQNIFFLSLLEGFCIFKMIQIKLLQLSFGCCMCCCLNMVYCYQCAVFEPTSYICEPLRWWLHLSASVEDDIIRKTSFTEYILYSMLRLFHIMGGKEVGTVIIPSVPMSMLSLPEKQLYRVMSFIISYRCNWQDVLLIAVVNLWRENKTNL